MLVPRKHVDLGGTDGTYPFKVEGASKMRPICLPSRFKSRVTYHMADKSAIRQLAGGQANPAALYD
jgi:hypothetical protein